MDCQKFDHCHFCSINLSVAVYRSAMKKELALTQYVDDLTILHLQGTLVSAGLVINGINGNK